MDRASSRDRSRPASSARWRRRLLLLDCVPDHGRWRRGRWAGRPRPATGGGRGGAIGRSAGSEPGRWEAWSAGLLPRASKVAKRRPTAFGAAHPSRTGRTASRVRRELRPPARVRAAPKLSKRCATRYTAPHDVDARPPIATRPRPRRSPTSPSRRASRCRPSRRSSMDGRTCRPRPGSRVEAAIQATWLPPSRTGPAGRPDPRADLPRARERVGARDRPRRRAGRRRAPPGGRAVRDAGPADAGPRLDRGRPRPPADRRHRGLLRPQRVDPRRSCAARGIPLVVVDPTGEPLHDTPSIGATNWNGGLTATRHLLGLGHRRIGVIGGPHGHPVQPGPAGRLPGGDGRGRRADRSAPHQPRPLPRRRGHREGPRAPAHCRTRRRRSSPATTCRPSASTRPRARPAAHPRGPQRRRLRRPAGRALGRSAAHDRPPAAHRDGRDGRRAGARPGRAASRRPRPRIELATELVVRESTAPPAT